MTGAALVVHGGGPTAVLNASLAGVVEASRMTSEITALYGAERGVSGLLEESLFDLYAEDASIWEDIARAPGSALGSSRRRIEPGDLTSMLAVFARRGVRYVFANGGNGTMEMAREMNRASMDAGAELRVIGIPKTIDNDLVGTDHTPGYGSAARFFAAALRDIGADNRALPGITVVEVLGRNAGWLAAATSLAREREDDAPHLIYFPERRLRLDQLLSDVECVYRRLGRAVIAVCEGQLDEKGKPFGADVRTSSRKPLALNLAHVLARNISAALRVPARSEKPGLLGRSCAALASPVDRKEARVCGAAAVHAAVEGHSGKMVALIREEGPRYKSMTELADLDAVAGRERLFPTEWIPDAPEAGLERFRAWAAPLIGRLDGYASLRGNRIVR